MLEHEELSGRVLGAAIAVHRSLGPGFVEAFYSKALQLELDAQGISFSREVPAKVSFRGQLLGVHKVDLLIEQKLVVELKSIERFDAKHFAILRSYLRATNIENGLLINFGDIKIRAHRVAANRFPRQPTQQVPASTIPGFARLRNQPNEP